jgi:uracil DNA glycosylase
MPKCHNAIDNNINKRRIDELEKKLHTESERQEYTPSEEEMYRLWMKIQELEKRILILENNQKPIT